MATYKEIILDNIKRIFGSNVKRYYGFGESDKIGQDLQNGAVVFPFLAFGEDNEYLACDNQNGIDLTTEIKVSSRFYVYVDSENIDDLIRLEETLKAKFSSPQGLVANGERCVSVSNLYFDTTREIVRITSNDGRLYESDVPMCVADIILPKEVVNPIKIELDYSVQLDLMKHLSLLDDYSQMLESKMEDILKSDQLRSYQSKQEKISHLSFDSKLKYQYYTRLYNDVEQQVSDMYTFENLCQEKIMLSDHGFKVRYNTMLEDNCDIKTATEKYKGKRAKELKREQRKQGEIRKWESVFSTNGDEALNLYADAVVCDIANKLHVNYPVSIFGGSNSMKYFLFNERGTLDFPNIFVYINANFSLENTSFMDLDGQGTPVSYNYTCEALPINLGFWFVVMATEKYQVDEIENQLYSMYANEVIVTVPDPVLTGNMCAVRLAVEPNVTPNDFPYFERIKGKNRLYHSIVVLTMFPSVYYTQCCKQSDIEYNERLQFRLLQRIEFFMLCDSYLRGRTPALLNKYYKTLFVQEQKSLLERWLDVPDNILKSEDYKKLKFCIQNNQLVDRELFNKTLSVITNEYPPLYDRMIQGWSVEQIQADMLKYADYFNREWNALLKNLADTACPEMYSQLNISRNRLDASLESIHKIIVGYIGKMSVDFYCTLKDAAERYSSDIAFEKYDEEKRQRQRELQRESQRELRRQEEVYYEPQGGLLRAMCDGMMEQYRTVDLLGSPHCLKAKGGECRNCNLRSKCTRGGLLNHLLR